MFRPLLKVIHKERIKEKIYIGGDVHLLITNLVCLVMEWLSVPGGLGWVN